MLPNNVSETHAESGDPLILVEAGTGPLIPFKLVCADLGIGRRTGGRRVPLPPLSKMMFPKKDHSRQKDGGFDHEHQRWPALRDNCRERHRGFLHPNQRGNQLWSAANLTVCLKEIG
jgi:hypothetical protein